MRTHINPFILICLAGLASIGFAQKAAEKSSSTDKTKESLPAFPYIAEITADNVHIRSDRGTQYYSCGKLNKADRVKVVSQQFGWSRIVPPAGSFSWISMQYVSIDPNNPSIGIVTGDNVRVYAGSDYVKPIHSTTKQLMLNKGEKVTLMGEEKDGYYKIVPTDGAYLWVSTQYTKPLGSVGEFPLTVEPRTQVEPEADTGVIIPARASVESQKLKEYYDLEKRIRNERAKPIEQQDYTSIKKSLLEIANDKTAGKAARYCRFAIEQIKRYELALEVAKAVRLQDAQLQQTKEGIEKARTTRLSGIQDLGRFAVIGQFQTSSIYGREAELKYYRIIDDSGRTVCYALPTGAVSKMDLSKFIDHKVGLVGTIQPHQQTAGALVQFTEIVKLNAKQQTK